MGGSGAKRVPHPSVPHRPASSWQAAWYSAPQPAQAVASRVVAPAWHHTQVVRPPARSRSWTVALTRSSQAVASGFAKG